MTAVIAAVYAASTLALSAISYGQVQFRVSEALNVLAVFCPEAVVGLSLGCLIANIFSPYGIVDVIFGTLATALAGVLGYLLRNVRVKGIPLPSFIMPAVVNGIIIGGEITFLTPDAGIAAFLPTAAWVALGELCVCLVIGIPLFLLLDRNLYFKKLISPAGVSKTPAFAGGQESFNEPKDQADKKGGKAVLYRIIAVISAVLFFWTLLPAAVAVVHPGVYVGCLASAALFFYFAFHDRINRYFSAKRIRKAFFIVFKAVACICAAVFIIISFFMIRSATLYPEGETKGSTVIVAGAQIRGDQPSLMLSRRLDKAAVYLKDNPDSLCVVSGSKGTNEQYTEAFVMKKYLVEKHGIDQSRIYTEENSLNTRQNMQFSSDVIRKNSLSENVVVATDFFHEYRCARELKTAGINNARSIPCATDWYFLPGYWVREVMAIINSYL